MSGRKFLRKKQLLKLMDRLPGTIYQFRQWKNGKCTFPYSTPVIESIFFASPRQLAKDGQIVFDRISPESIDLVQKTLKDSAENLTEFEMTFCIRSPQDRIHWIHNHAIPERLRDGSTLWHGYMENITHEYEAKEAAKQKAALLNVIFNNLEDQFYYKDRESRILGGNTAWMKARGHETLDDLIGKTDIDLFPAPLGKQLYMNEQHQMETGEATRTREQHVQKDGSIKYVESIKCPMHNTQGKVIGLAGISRDITQQVVHEKELLAAKQEAEHSAAFVEAIFNNLEDCFYYKDRESRILGGNTAWMKARGHETLDDLIGKTDIDLFPAPLGKQLYENEQRQMETGEVTRIRERHLGADGQVTYVESVKCPMRNNQGEVIGLAGISRDVTRQVENEKVLIEAQQAAEAANKAKSAFLAMMSHEIRTPMNGVIGASSLLLGTELTTQQEEFVHTIEVSGENLLTIINDILDYSKIEAGKIELEKISFSLRQCIEDAFDLFVQAAAKKNIELLYYVDPDVPKTLIGDTTRLRQVIVNLMGNSIKFTENGEVSLKVHNLIIDEKQRTCHLEFAVKDTGVGIADEHKSRLFQAFTQADSSSTRKYGGTGLGLTISRRLTELMGGKVWFESEAGKGSTFFFTVTLPIGVTSDKAQKMEFLPIEQLRGKRALIVDDNETNRWLLSDQLAQWGMLSVTFEHPEKALQHLKDDHPYDIALIDYQMPGMNGEDLAKAIYRFKKKPAIPVIILSSSYEQIPPDPSITAHLSKPVKVGKLRENILQVLGTVRAESKTIDAAGTQIQPKKKRTMRILVAEDNTINQRVIKMMLQQLGCENAVIVSDGDAAVAAAADAPYDVILMDVQMPHLNGLEATAKIRELTGNPDKPWIIALTAGVMKEEQDAVKKAGMNGFLAKPLSIKQLQDTLDNLAPAS